MINLKSHNQLALVEDWNSGFWFYSYFNWTSAFSPLALEFIIHVYVTAKMRA